MLVMHNVGLGQAAVCEVTHHLKLVLPEFLLFRLVKERKLADMVDEYVS